jgi:transposase
VHPAGEVPVGDRGVDGQGGQVVGGTELRHRPDRTYPGGLVERGAVAVTTWLLQHPRFHLHFTPTGSSWLNLVERFFAEITMKLLRRGIHRSVTALEQVIRAWIQQCNTNPKPYIWTRTADQILESLAAYCRRIDDSGH